MKSITMSDGLELEIDEGCMDDMELLDAIIDTDEGNPVAVSRLCTKMLGKEGKKILYDHLRENNGRVPVTKAIPAIMEIMQLLGKTENDAKNS